MTFIGNQLYLSLTRSNSNGDEKYWNILSFDTKSST